MDAGNEGTAMHGRDAAGDSGHGGPAKPDVGSVDWRLTDLPDERGDLLPVDPDVLATATFSDGRVSGSAGCNRYMGAFALDGRSMRLTGIASTMRACPPPHSTVEAAFLSALDRVTGFALAAGRLDLLSADGAVLLRFEPRPAIPLVGTTWSAVGVNNGRGGVTSLVAGSAISATFAADGRVSGETGCNAFHGPYSLDGSRLRVGPLATTRRACPDEQLREQEGWLIGALERVATFSVDGDELELRAEDGALQVGLRMLRAPER
jgi:heat shock protein HslJ